MSDMTPDTETDGPGAHLDGRKLVAPAGRLCPPRRIAIILACAAVGTVAAFTQYVHSGYVGVVDGTSPLRLLDRGLHARAPWQRVVFYPTRSGSVGITTIRQVPAGTLRAEIRVFLSVRSDSVEALHRAHGGQYVQALVVPAINRFFEIHGDRWTNWTNDRVVNTRDKDLATYLDASLAPHGVNVFQVWFESFEVSAGAEPLE